MSSNELAHLEQQEKQVAQLVSRVASLQALVAGTNKQTAAAPSTQATTATAQPESDGDSAMEKLVAENERLKYQLAILNRSIAEEKASGAGAAAATGAAAAPAAAAKGAKGKEPAAKDAAAAAPAAKKKADKPSQPAFQPAPVPTYQPVDLSEGRMVALFDHVRNMLEMGIEATFPGKGFANAMLVGSNVSYKSAAALTLLKRIDGLGFPYKTAHDIASAIHKNLPKSTLLESSHFEVDERGFITVVVPAKLLATILTNIVVHGVLPPKQEKKKRVIIDFSSPNIAKEMHVGHLRSTIIGESLCRLLEYRGFEVLRVNHVGDWGTQFGMLIAHLKDEFPNFRNESPPIGDLQAFYKASKKRFDADEEFKKRAYTEVVKLQAGTDADVRHAWKLICDESRREFELIYKRLHVTIKEKGESFYQPMMPSVVADLEKRGFVQVEDGRKIMFVPDQAVPLTVEKSDGGYTYDTSDLAAIKYRIEEEHADWIIYVVDVGQSLHLETVFSAAKHVGWLDPAKVRVDHVAFGLVLGEDGKKFKTRSGDTVRLVDLLDEAVERAKVVLDSKRGGDLQPEEYAAALDAVSYGAVKYADLSTSRTSDYTFSFDRMLKLVGNTAPYLLYAYTRMSSIARNAGIDVSKEIAKHPCEFTEGPELALARALIRFPEILNRITDDLMPHTLGSFLYEICQLYSTFYEKLRIIEHDVDKATGTKTIKSIHYPRLALCEAASLVLKQGLSILGMDVVGKM
ncbi:rars protein [Capsaspora owczarzaki ATCC 30864]|uniref:arginine--tRNA ligase n=2 Tax=Capsaspora owczarzaki (strain ATCC 30864) TaxID=595528 RepID=A0A0D2WW26_CAPO3|nr:rars protein [Capsaspora owczarzaki ATCC 30864]